VFIRSSLRTARFSRYGDGVGVGKVPGGGSVGSGVGRGVYDSGVGVGYTPTTG